MLDCLLEGAWGLNTRTSMNVFSRLPPQKPLTAMSSLAPSEMLEERVDITSPVSSCRSGSTRTSLQTSVRRLAVKSLISLWRIEGNPPLGQERACSTEKEAPQTQCEGVRARLSFGSLLPSRQLLLPMTYRLS